MACAATLAVDLTPAPVEVDVKAVGKEDVVVEVEARGCGGGAVVVAAADAEGHPYDFHVSGPRNLPLPNWREIIRSSW
jgi:hypothetical protein